MEFEHSRMHELDQLYRARPFPGMLELFMGEQARAFTNGRTFGVRAFAEKLESSTIREWPSLTIREWSNFQIFL